MSPTWVADARVIFVHPNGERVPGRIAVDAPELTAEGDARCVVALDGCSYVGKGVLGETPLEALLFGVRLLGHVLHDFLERGGRVLYPEEDQDVDFDLGALFGPLLCAVPPAAEDADDSSAES